MLADSTWSRYGRKVYLLKRIRAIVIVIAVISVVIVGVLAASRFQNDVVSEKRELLRVWNEGGYEQAREISKNALLNDPVDYFMLTINGFSAYQLGISQINNQNTIHFIDECIFSLRKALIQNNSASVDGRVCYVLGKAYGYKGVEYSDLAVKYLEMADNVSYDASDIPEYLGLAYAAYGDYRSSVEAFSRAFVPGSHPSDNLLLSIARSYMAMEDYDMAISYLRRCIDVSFDSRTVVLSRLMLAEIYVAVNDYDNAEAQYLSIISDTGDSANVNFLLGELYSLRGDATRARSQWRLAYRQDPAHAGARARLNI